MNERWERIEGGIWGMLVGDALGVPFEFCHHASLPDLSMLDYELPPGYAKSHAHVPVGTWSDDGAQALCLLTSLMDCQELDMKDFAGRLLRWYRHGYLAVDGFAFDVGNQTCEALNRLDTGCDPSMSGLRGAYNNGNGSLMRCLPIALMGPDCMEELIDLAHRQSLVTHAHRRSQVACAYYVVWARAELDGVPNGWEFAAKVLRDYYSSDPLYLEELNKLESYDTSQCHGGTYVLDTLHSVRLACSETSFEAVIKRAIRFGNDTDTVASLAGGIAGLRHRMKGIPYRWKSRLRGLKILFPVMQRLCMEQQKTSHSDASQTKIKDTSASEEVEWVLLERVG